MRLQKIGFVFLIVLFSYQSCKTTAVTKTKDLGYEGAEGKLILFYRDGDNIIIKQCENTSFPINREDCQQKAGTMVATVFTQDFKLHMLSILKVSDLAVNPLIVELKKVNGFISELGDDTENYTQLKNNLEQKLVEIEKKINTNQSAMKPISDLNNLISKLVDEIISNPNITVLSYKADQENLYFNLIKSYLAIPPGTEICGEAKWVSNISGYEILILSANGKNYNLLGFDKQQNQMLIAYEDVKKLCVANYKKDPRAQGELNLSGLQVSYELPSQENIKKGDRGILRIRLPIIPTKTVRCGSWGGVVHYGNERCFNFREIQANFPPTDGVYCVTVPQHSDLYVFLQKSRGAQLCIEESVTVKAPFNERNASDPGIKYLVTSPSDPKKIIKDEYVESIPFQKLPPPSDISGNKKLNPNVQEQTEGTVAPLSTKSNGALNTTDPHSPGFVKGKDWDRLIEERHKREEKARRNIYNKNAEDGFYGVPP